MEKIVFLNDTDTIYDAVYVNRSDNICSIKFDGVIPDTDILTSGFYIINEYTGDNMSGDSFYNFKTVYRNLSPIMQLSNDGSIYIPPTPPKPQTKNIIVNVVWDDNNNEDGVRPDQINVDLYQDGIYVKTGTVTKKGGWKFDFGEFTVDKEYTISAKKVYDYTPSISLFTVIEKHETFSQVKAAKLAELDSDCNKAMQSSIVVNLESGAQDFAFTELVQRDLANAYSSATALIQVGKTDIGIPFYNSDNVCQLYSPKDIMTIYMTLGVHKTNNLTLLHQLEDQIESIKTKDALKAITFDVKCLDDKHKDSYNAQMEAAANVIRAISDIVIYRD